MPFLTSHTMIQYGLKVFPLHTSKKIKKKSPRQKSREFLRMTTFIEKKLEESKTSKQSKEYFDKQTAAVDLPAAKSTSEVKS